MDAATHPRKRTLELTISSLDELREDWKPALKNLYVAVRADSITSYATGTAEDCGGNSSWNETLVVEVPAHARSVTLEVKCRNSPGVKDVGVARIAVTDFLSGAAAGSDECERYAVVTGANKGIGFGMCEKLASSGIVVVLTARDEKRGLKAVEKLKEFGLSDFIVFHQLDVNDPASVATLADFIKTQFGKLDILVNNAAVTGGKLLDGDALLRKRNGEQIDWSEVGYQTYELAEQCVETNFYGVERVTEALVPLLQLSISPRIINISSRAGLLKNIPNEWARRMFSDIENLTREKIDGVLKEFQKDFKEGSLENKGWPAFASAYTMSKAALNAYTRVMAKKYPHFHINSVCPGFVKTDMNNNTGQLSIDEGTQTPLMLALMPNSVPSGCFFNQGEVIPF
uniref:(+)-neomenthol dehydrogenase n=1 Tax=Cajanus cajan TaxID=3821 RepID=A0A151TBI1_CAJCA|nr:(+)-neomenthol dehydrogenase [Cajanus cajan]